MRIVATLAAILALPCSVFADEPQTPEINITIAPPAVSVPAVSQRAATQYEVAPSAAAQPAGTPADVTASGKFDTSVYHLKHTRARQIIPAVRQSLCKSLAAEAADQQIPSVVSVVFMPTTSDDTLVAICPREHAELVKQAIEDCDVEKQYAVRVQLFEVSPNGEAVPAGDPAIVVGREGSVECKTSGNCPVTVSLQVSDPTSAAAALSNNPVSTESSDEPYCCGPDCGRPDAELSAAKDACPGAGVEEVADKGTCPACGSKCPFSQRELSKNHGISFYVGSDLPVCRNGECSSCKGQCSSCKGQCAACKNESAASCAYEPAACSKCETASTCKGQSADSCACSSDGSCACESAASCKCGSACSCGKSCEAGEKDELLTAKDYQMLVRILSTIWLREHHEQTGSIARDEAAETGECCPEHEAAERPQGVIAPAGAVEAPAQKGVDLGCPAPAPSETSPATSQSDTRPEFTPGPIGTADIVSAGPEGMYLWYSGAHCNDDGFRASGVYRLGASDQSDDVAVTRVTDKEDYSLLECGGQCQAALVEPPALLTLSRHKENAPNLGLAVAPPWQAELAKIYQGRRLSEIFDSHNGQDAGARALGRLLAEIPKPGCESDGDLSRRHNVIVVDLPDRIRVFESPSDVAPAAAPACTNCREQFRAFLEEVFQGSNVLEEIAQAGHTQEDAAITEPPRELPSAAHSKLETTVVTYPLRDLVLLDDSERPVFDTCTIIDHIQSAVAPETWGHPSVSIQLDQQSMNLVIRQTPDVHKRIEAHLRDLRRLQFKQLSNLVERLSLENESTDD